MSNEILAVTEEGSKNGGKLFSTKLATLVLVLRFVSLSFGIPDLKMYQHPDYVEYRGGSLTCIPHTRTPRVRLVV